MTDHYCDSAILIDRSDTPLTMLRVLRVLHALLNKDLANANHTMGVFGYCPRCLRQALSIAIAHSVTALAEPSRELDEQLMDLQMRIAALESRVEDES